MADVLDLRLKAPPVRAAAAVSTLTVSLFYLLAQMAGAGALAASAAVTTVWVLSRAGFSLPSLLQHAAASSPAGTRVLGPGLEYGVSTTTKLDFVSLALALVLGTAACRTC
jgi:cation/acetate symporter